MANNIPILRFSEFSEKQPFIKFGKVVESNLYGPRFNAKDYHAEGNVKTIRGTDVSNSGELRYEQVPLAKLDQNTVDNHKLKDGDLVMITTADCGLTGVFREQEIDYISSAYGVRIRLNEKGYPFYFKYFFQTRHAKKEVASFVRKATVANLPGSDILRIRLNLPSPTEQTKIATFLTAVDKRINLLQKKKTELEQYKKGVMQKLFSQTLRFKNDNSSDFEDWEVKKLGEVLDYLQPTKFLVSSTEYNNEYKTPVLTAGKTFILGYSNETEGIFSENLPAIIFDDFTTAFKFVDFPFKAKSSAMKMLIPVDKNVNIKFIFEVMKTIKFPLAEHKRYWISEYQNEKIPYPSKDEQQKIATFLSSIDKSIENIANQIDDSVIFKKGLLQKMFV